MKVQHLTRKIAFFLTLLLLSSGIAKAQTTITGTITDGETQDPMPGATVSVKGTTQGTITNAEGQYEIQVDPGQTLVFSFIGFISQEVEVKNQEAIDVTLNPEVKKLDEVVVTGYGTQTRNEMTTAISKVNTKSLESAPTTNAATSLQGTVAGLNVTQTTGQPGSTPDMTLRGGTSFEGSGTPLILIDGVPGSFYALNPDDIESMEVLKDAASTAIYGARAANGVILVTTKSGKEGRTNVTFRTKLTNNKRREDPMDYLDAAEYVKYNRLAVKHAQDVMGYPWLNQFLTGAHSAGTGNNTTNSIYTTMELSDDNRYLLDYEGWETMEDPVNPGTDLIFMDNQLNDLFYQDSHAQDYSVSLDGGNDKGTFYLGLGFQDNKGLVFGSNFKRMSGTFNGSYDITDALKATAKVTYAHSSQDLPFEDDYDLFQRTAGLAPTHRIYNNNPDGSLSEELQPGTYVGFGNPLYYQDKFIEDNLEQRLKASVQFDYQITDDFKATLRGSHFTVNNSNESFNKAYLNSGSLNTDRQASASHARTLRDQVTGMLKYNTRLGENHNVNALLGTEYFREKSFNFNAATRLSPTDLIPTMNVGSEASGTPHSYRTGYEIASVFGQVNYDFDYKYLVGLTFRRDGTSRLGNNKWDFFPGISLGWNVHEEDFFKESVAGDYISRLKPRLSYGVNGNIEVLSNFGVFGTYGTTSAYDTQTGYANTNLPLLDLKWERSTTLNFGLDMGLFNDRLTFIGDYFVRDVKDKLADQNLPLWTGFSSITTNNGTLRNKGLELQVNSDIVKTNDWNWNLGITYYSVKNYAHKLPDNGVENNRQGGQEIYDPETGETKYVGGLQEGKRVGYDLITAYVFDGVYQTQEDIDEHSDRVVEFATKPETRFLGDTRWKDRNDDGVINHLDRKVMGRTTPDFTGGLTSDLTYKNFNLYVKTDFAVGHHLINGRRVKGISQTQGNQNGPAEIANSWTPENPDSNIPIFTLVDRQNNHLAAGWDQGSRTDGSSRMLEKGDYLALREVTLSYNMPGEFANNIFNNLRVYLTGTNLKYFNSFSGSMPEEAGNNGIDMGRFPLPRTYTLGLNVSF
ncbi:MAG: SusC/RagA family TonB-linked outer membrane protein [Bacteroidota bacterium]